jgi:hypothetical protein
MSLDAKIAELADMLDLAGTRDRYVHINPITLARLMGWEQDDRGWHRGGNCTVTAPDGAVWTYSQSCANGPPFFSSMEWAAKLVPDGHSLSLAWSTNRVWSVAIMGPRSSWGSHPASACVAVVQACLRWRVSALRYRQARDARAAKEGAT